MAKRLTVLLSPSACTKRMGLGKEKAKKKAAALKKKHAKKRKNNAKIIFAYRAMEEARSSGDVDATETAGEEEKKGLTGRQKHALKVAQKRQIREMLTYKRAERLQIRKSTTDGDLKSIRKGMCDEIKILREAFARTKDGSAGMMSKNSNQNNESAAVAMES